MSGLLDEVSLQRLEFRTPAGRRIVGLAATPRHTEPRGLVVLFPGFGRDMRSLGAMSRLLNRYGYATLRYDATDHVGESDGEILNARFMSFVSDTKAVMADIPPAFARLPRFFIASSLAARPAVRALQHAELAGMVLIMPAVNLRRTMLAVLGEDLVGAIREGRPLPARETISILSHEVSMACFHETVAHDLDTLEGMRAELAALQCPVTAIAGKEDAWIDVQDVFAAMGPLSARREVFVLESGSHNLLNLPLLRLLKETTVRTLEAMNGRTIDTVRDLDFSETVETAKSEKRFMQQHARPRGEVPAEMGLAK